MTHRKGERPIAKPVRPYTSDHPVARWIADGDHWLAAWVGQMTTSWATITRKTKITQVRLEQFSYEGAEPTDDEILALAELWRVTPEGLRRSIADARGK